MQPTFDIYASSIRVGDGVWLATDVFVAPGVCIGDDSVVGARSSVFSNLPSGMVCYGAPAQAVENSILWRDINSTGYFIMMLRRKIAH